MFDKKLFFGTLRMMVIFTILSSCSSSNIKLQGDMILWYDKPAEAWLDASPIGNGFIGGKVFGKTAKERIALNETTFWSGAPHDYNNPSAGEHYEYIKEQLFAGKYAEMGDYITKNFNGIPHILEAFQPLGDLFLTFPDVDSTAVTDYRREMDMETGIVTVSYKSGDVTYNRETFVSYPDKVMVIRITTDKKKSLNMQASVESVFTESITSGNAGEMIVEGTWIDTKPPQGRWGWLIA